MTFTLLLLFALLLGIGLGAVIGWSLKDARSRGEIALACLRTDQAENESRRLAEEMTRGREELARFREEARNEQTTLTEVLTAQFRNLATEILEERTKTFSQTSSEKIGGLLSR